MEKKLTREEFQKMLDELGVKETEKIKNQVIGLNEKDAKKLILDNGLTSRVVSRDGRHFMSTLTYSVKRINLDINSGIVVDATIG